MIDCLSNPEWLNSQINFLLYLQQYRVGHLEFLDKFFLSVTVFGEFWLPTIICAVTYWCIDFRAGIYLFSLEALNVLFAHLFKMLACVYRPWILNSNVHPSALAVPYAKGYSFPSGHSAMASSVLGGVAYLLKNKKIWCIGIVGLILIVGFSRLWLGVHTPQDVICGLTMGMILVFLLNKMVNWAEENKNRYLYLLFIINIFAILALIYVSMFNSYRIDYIDGEILVNPKKSIYVTIVVYGYALGLLDGCFLCRRFLPFEPKADSIKCRVLRGVVGIILLLLMLKFVLEFIIMNTVNLKTALLLMFLMGNFVTLIYPVIFSKIRFYKK